jgi:hypothetical protein
MRANVTFDTVVLVLMLICERHFEAVEGVPTYLCEILLSRKL